MKNLAQRTWEDDFEFIYENNKPYIKTLFNLNKISDLSIRKFNESWFRMEDQINIRINYSFKDTPRTLWVNRISDYLDSSFLFLINTQLNLEDYRFEASWKEEAIYFIDHKEKEILESQNIEFERLDSINNIPSIILNILMNSKNNLEENFTYDLLDKLNTIIIPFSISNSENEKNIIQLQTVLQSKLFPVINWEEVGRRNIRTDNIYAFIKI